MKLELGKHCGALCFIRGQRIGWPMLADMALKLGLEAALRRRRGMSLYRTPKAVIPDTQMI